MSDSRPSSRNREPGTRLGSMKCWSCQRDIPVKKMPSGKLSLNCDWCEFPHYANKDTEHYQNVLARTTLDKPAEASPAAASAAKVAEVATVAVPAAEPEKKAPARPFTGPLFGGKR